MWEGGKNEKREMSKVWWGGENMAVRHIRTGVIHAGTKGGKTGCR